MSRRRRPGSLWVVLLAALPWAATASGPREVAVRFYAAVQMAEPDDARIGALLGPELRAAVAAQRVHEQACSVLAAPGEKPHMLDQSLYLWAPDRPSSVEVGMPSGSGGDAAWIDVQMSVADSHWRDRVLLRRQGKAWQIVEIRWGQGGTLVQRLKEFSVQRCVRQPPEATGQASNPARVNALRG